MIDLQGKNKYVIPVIEAAGYSVSGLDGVMGSTNDVAVQAIIDNYNPLVDVQTEAIKTISQYANDLIDKDINPIRQRRINADALNATIKKGKGAINAAEQAKLDRYEASIVYPDKIFSQYDIEEAAILAQTDFRLIDVEAAKANLDAIV